MSETPSYWRKCSSCKRPINFGAPYYICSVSTCNRKRSALVFCNIRCWDAHVPVMNHRVASAEERRAPSREESERGHGADSESVAAGPEDAADGKDILVVASRVKAYILARSGMNTSAGAFEILSDHVRAISDKAIEKANRAGRQTVLERDVERLPAPGKKQSVVIRRRPQT